MTTDTNHPDTSQKKIVSLYAAFGAGLALSVVPFMAAVGFSMVFILGVLVAAYILRSGTAQDSLVFNHTTFVIRTIWIGGFIALLTTTAAAVYLFEMLDNTPLDPCIRQFITIGPETMMMDVVRMQAVFSGCFHDYVSTNIRAFLISAAIAAGPVLVYFAVRYARGLSRALEGYRVARPEAWF
jgi:uncharacterized membrane protein